jgi:hypothetical protein
MDSKIAEAGDKAHAVCIPLPGQSHIKAMLKFAKLLHAKGFHITFVNTEFNHQLFLKSRGPNVLDGLPDFQFKTISDGLPPSDPNATQDVDAICKSIMGKLLGSIFRHRPQTQQYCNFFKQSSSDLHYLRWFHAIHSNCCSKAWNPYCNALHDRCL